jgi:predicted phage-related endonuclease
MSNIFGGSPKKPERDPELERLRAEAAAKAENDKQAALKKEEEERIAVERRLRGSRSLFANGTKGFQTEKKTELGNA